MFYIEGTMIIIVVGTVPLLEVVCFWLAVVLVGEGGGGGTTSPLVAIGMGVLGLPKEVALFSSIANHLKVR